MEAYRDQYATLFNNGRKVVVIGISVDPDTTLANWARDSEFPVVFASDTSGSVGAAYGAYDQARKIDTRSLYVIGPDGKIAHKTQPFRVLDAQDLRGAVVRDDRVEPQLARDGVVADRHRRGSRATGAAARGAHGATLILVTARRSGPAGADR